MKVPRFKFGIPNISKLTHGHKFNPGLGTLLRNTNFPKPEPKTKDRQRFSRSQDLEKEFSKMYQRACAPFRKLTPHPFTPVDRVCASGGTAGPKLPDLQGLQQGFYLYLVMLMNASIPMVNPSCPADGLCGPLVTDTFRPNCKQYTILPSPSGAVLSITLLLDHLRTL